jgi:hypothetical protein
MLREMDGAHRAAEAHQGRYGELHSPHEQLLSEHGLGGVEGVARFCCAVCCSVVTHWSEVAHSDFVCMLSALD